MSSSAAPYSTSTPLPTNPGRSSYTPGIAILFRAIDFQDIFLWISFISIAFNPLFWNIFARLQYKTKFFSKLVGDKYIACYILAACIFLLGLLRDYLFVLAMKYQPKSRMLANIFAEVLGYGFIIVGNVFVWSSMFKLGITGTYLGDYFGILMKKRVTGFPFNVLSNPMYDGSSIIFLGTALCQYSAAGVFLSFWVYTVYQITLMFEGPFTDYIYNQKNITKIVKKKK